MLQSAKQTVRGGLKRLLSMSPQSSPSLPAKKSKNEETQQHIAQLLRNNPKPVDKPLVWIDCEMTGLDVNRDYIIEICCLITDGDLNIVDENGYESVVYQPKAVLDAMDEWCLSHHGDSGLMAKVLAHPENVASKVQAELLAYVQKYIPRPRSGMLAGNSIHMDKFFMMKEFPQVIDHLHYRLLDVSAIMEFGFRHNRPLMRCCPKKVAAHTARADIEESINQLKWYREHYFKSRQETAHFVAEYDAKRTEASDADAVNESSNTKEPKPAVICK